MTVTEPTETFSAMLRNRTTGEHRDAERNDFMTNLLRGRVPIAGYIDMLAQHAYLYEALEAPAEAVATDEAVARVIDPVLDRGEALEADLLALAGETWRDDHPPVPATERYVARVREVAADWPAGYVAHHYTRYLGDLSGGQHIGRLAARTYGLEERVNDNFARFDIEDLDAYKNAYRAALDAAEWDADEKQRVLDEIQEAYRFNSEVFADLSHHVPEVD